jgi:hypothetical protein
VTAAADRARIGWRAWTAATVGLAGAASLWAINTQLGEILPYPECRLKFPFAMLVSLFALLLTLAAGWTSWRTARDASVARPSTFVFTARMAAGTACLFAFALMLQGAADLILSGCER